MGDPELRSDEKVLVRTQGVYVKSIPFEGILTNKRVILVDRAKNLLPSKEIPLVTIKDVETGENAIRDQTLTLSVMAKSGETRQMILTFSRQTGGNRAKERDEWVKVIKENTTSSFEQVIRKVIPGFEQAPKKTEPTAPPRIEVVNTTVVQTEPSATKTSVKKETEGVHPIKKIIESGLVASSVKDTPAPEPAAAVFCSQCGNKVPVSSVFCNRCGSKIIMPGPVPVVQPTPLSYKPSSDMAGIKKSQPVDEGVLSIEPRIERSDMRIRSDTMRAAPPQPGAEKPATASRARPRSYSPLYDNPPEEPGPVSVTVAAEPPPSNSPPPSSGREPPSPQKPKGICGFKPGKGVIMGLGAILIIILVIIIGAYFIYPMVTEGGSNVVPGPTQTVVTPSPAVQPTATQVFIPEKTPVPVPATGIYVHVVYLGGWKGSYGIPSALQSVINSGDRFYEIENATSTVNATFEKLDGSTRHNLTVEIYKNGKVLTKGETTAGFGKVAVSVNVATGVAQAPLTSTGTKPTMTPSLNVTTVMATAQPTSNLTTLKTTVPVTNTTTSAP